MLKISTKCIVIFFTITFLNARANVLIRFTSDVAGHFIMLGDNALPLLRLMGMSGREEGAVSGDDLRQALQTLQAALQRAAELAAGPVSDNEDDEQEAVPVSLQRRALPLLEMLQRAAREDGYVMWQPD
jgi:hypothetical protein